MIEWAGPPVPRLAPGALYERVHLARSREVLLGQPARAVRAERQRHALVVDQDVGMVVRGLRVEREPRDERDRVGKAAQRVLLADGGALQRPPVEPPEFRLNLRLAQLLRHPVSIRRKRPERGVAKQRLT